MPATEKSSARPFPALARAGVRFLSAHCSKSARRWVFIVRNLRTQFSQIGPAYPQLFEGESINSESQESPLLDYGLYNSGSGVFSVRESADHRDDSMMEGSKKVERVRTALQDILLGTIARNGKGTGHRAHPKLLGTRFGRMKRRFVSGCSIKL